MASWSILIKSKKLQDILNVLQNSGGTHPCHILAKSCILKRGTALYFNTQFGPGPVWQAACSSVCKDKCLVLKRRESEEDGKLVQVDK